MTIKAIGMTNPVLQFVDGAGVPYAGGSITFYAAGLSSLQDVYSDAAASVALPNPVPLNAAGRSSTSTTGSDTPVYFQQLPYDATLKDAAGTTIWGPISFAGSEWPGSVQGQALSTPAANANAYANRLTTTIAKASSGTHALFAGTRFDIPTITAGASTLTESDTVYIEGAPATGTNPYAIHVDAGNVLFDGDLTVLGAFNQVSFGLNNFRLSLATGTPVSINDVTAATTIYAVPYGGSQICLYTSAGVAMAYTSSSQFSIAVPASTSQMYDVFCYANGLVPTLELTAWTSDTARATAIVANVAAGIYTKSGDATRRYLGSFRTTGVSGQTEDSFAKRYLWNYYYRVIRGMRVTETTDSWAYSTATYRQANGAAANQLDVVIGAAEVLIDVAVYGAVSNTDGAGVALRVAIGEDSTTAPATGTMFGPVNVDMATNTMNPVSAFLRKYPAIGRHTYVWLEQGAATNTTWYGDGGAVAQLNQGITGTING